MGASREAEIIAVLRTQNEMSPGINKAKADVQGFAGHVSSAVGTLAGFAGGIGIINGVSSALSVAKNAAFGMNSTLETTTLQFHSLGMSTTDASAHVKDLFQFAKETPFETGPIIEASRQLRVFGGANLDTIANLRLFGDTSAATNADLGQLTFWFGRLYSAAQSGKPFGEAIQNLQQLGVLSPQTVTKLSQMSEGGAKFGDVWKVVTGDLQRFNGAMKDQAGTWQGLTSTISDAINITGAQVLQPFFKMAEQGAGKLADALGSDRVTKGAQHLSEMLGSTLKRATDIGGAAMNSFQVAMRATGNPIAGVDAALLSLADGLGVPRPAVLALNQVFLDAVGIFTTVQGFIRGVLIAAFENLSAPIQHLADVIGSNVIPPLDKLVTKITEWVRGGKDAGSEMTSAAAAVDLLTGPLQALGAVIDVVADNFDVAKVAIVAIVAVWGTWKAVMVVTTAIAWGQTAAIYAYVVATYIMRAAVIVATVAQWAWNIAMLANPIGLIIVAIVALIAVLVLLVLNWDFVTKATLGAWNAFVTFLQQSVAAQVILTAFLGPIILVIAHFQQLRTWVIAVANQMPAFAGAVWSAASSVVSAVGSMAYWFGQLPGRVWSAVSGIPGMLWNLGQQAAGSLASALRSIHIPSPHFNIVWSHIGAGPVGVDVPTISFGGWYASGAIFTKPTLVGVGEGGRPEGVFPLPRGYNPNLGPGQLSAGQPPPLPHFADRQTAPRGGSVTNIFHIHQADDPEKTWQYIQKKLGGAFAP